MKKKINIEIIIDNEYSNPKIMIYTKEKNKEIEQIIEYISSFNDDNSKYINGYIDNKLELVKINDIVRIGRVGRQVILETEDKSYILKKTITQLEDELDKNKFIRISQSEIINAYKVKSLDLSFSGTIIIEFTNGFKSNVSRRYVKFVKNFFKD